MKIQGKAKIAMAAILVAIVLFSGGAVALSMGTKSLVKRYSSDQAKMQLSVQKIQADFYAYDDQMNMYVLAAMGRNRSLQDVTYKQAVGAGNQLMASIHEAQSLPASPAVASELSRIHRDAVAYSGYASQVFSAVSAGNVARASYIQTEGNLAPSNDIMVALSQLFASTTASSASALGAIGSESSTSALVTTIGSGLAILALAGLLYAFLRGVMRPLYNLIGKLTALADGSNEVERLDDTRADEFGDVGRAFNRFSDRLSGMIAGFSESVTTLLQSTGELEAVASSLLEGSRQTVQVAETSGNAVEEVTTNFHAVSAATEEMRIAIAEIARSATDAAAVAGKAVGVAQETSSTISALGEASQEVSEVVSTINGIAEQTNLLALNAAIEAARAGEAGKGFAVVASEVKELARNTARATEEIARRLESIRGESLAAVDAIGNISAVIANINDIQSSIASAVEEQSVTTNEISRVAEQSVAGAQQIAVAMDQVNRSSKASFEAVNEAQRVVERLTALADSVGSLVGVKTGRVPHASSDANRRFGLRGEAREGEYSLIP